CVCDLANGTEAVCTPGGGGSFPADAVVIECYDDGGVFGGNESWPDLQGLDLLQEFYIEHVSAEGELDVLGELPSLTVLRTGPGVELRSFPEGLTASSTLQNLTIASSQLENVSDGLWVLASLINFELNSTGLECLSPLSWVTDASLSLNGETPAVIC
ncbi:Hypothetical Protein FCC1311_118392, partial [Hondaea fermentalgiana]